MNKLNFLNKLYCKIKQERESFILNNISNIPNQRILILGICEGTFANKIMKKASVNIVYGIEIEDNYIQKLSTRKNIIVKKGDLNKQFPYENNFFDLVIADQVIEHLYDQDNFINEIKRVLKTEKNAIISTENLASWYNIIALILGYYPFSLDYSHKIKIGNPLSPYYKKEIKHKHDTHIKVCTPRALFELLEFYQLNLEKKYFNGFFPLPCFLSKLFPTHSYFLTFIVKK